jgi:hypothetical protein
MIIEYEESSSDFDTPSLKIISQTRQEAFSLGCMFQQIDKDSVKSGSGGAFDNCWIRVKIQKDVTMEMVQDKTQSGLF